MNFLEALEKQVIVIDGAMGTMIQGLNLGYEDFGGESFQMLSDLLTFSKPDALKDIHLAYFRAGSNAVETNTFGASPLRLEEYDFTTLDTSAFAAIPYGLDLQSLSYEEMAYWMNRAGAEIARKALDEFRSSEDYDGRPLYVLGSIGPSNYVLSSTNADLHKGTWEQVEQNFHCQVTGLIDGGVDVLLFETQQDILEVKAAVSGAKKAMKEKGVSLPVMVQVTVDEFSRMQIFNTDIHAALTTVEGIGIDTFGINCSLGPDLMEPTVEKIARYSKLPISVIPNAGMPESENGIIVYRQGPEDLAGHLRRFVEQYGINVVGGCCGTSPAHIEAVAQSVRGLVPAERVPDKTLYISGPQKAVAVDSSEHLIRIGERLNVRGSKKVREAVESADGEMNTDALEEVVNEQLHDLGVGIIDVCMDSNVVSTKDVLPQVIQAMTIDFKGAMCLDSFDAEALVEAVKAYPGRPVVNSISMEEHEPGVTKADAIVPLTCFHNPLYIALATGPEGPATTADKKVQLAAEIVDTCAKYGVDPGQLLIDINAFPIGSESVEGMNFALESLDSIPRIKALHPEIKTTIGVSNLTNGLAKKPYMRVVLTSIFLDEGRKRGLDAAIVNPNHYVPVESIDRADYELGLEIIMKRDMDAFAELEEIAEAKQGVRTAKRTSYDGLAPEDAICEKIKNGYKQREKGTVEVDGMVLAYRDRIVLDAAEAVKTVEPLRLINDYLMKAMKELGDRFAAGEASLPHLLKSADVMKQVMEFLESCMKKNSDGGESGGVNYKGTVVIGTVHQDVHSIGKDLCKTLYENYGYRVIDLGVQVPLEDFISTAVEEKADAIGMSALLVQTSNHMITVARMMEEAGLDIPILIGGAPVNNRHAAFVAMRGQDDVEKIKPDVFYCNSALDGVNVLETVLSGNGGSYIEKNREELKKHYLMAVHQGEEKENLVRTLPRRKIHFDDYSVPDVRFGVHMIEIPVSEMDLNVKSLYGLNWKMGGMGSWEQKGVTREDMEQLKDQWISRADDNGWIKPVGITGLFPCQADGDEVIVYDPEGSGRELCRVDFKLLVGKDREDLFSVADCFYDKKSGKMDVIGFQIATAGAASMEAVNRFKAENNSEAAHLLQGLADRTAEDLAGMLHAQLRRFAGKNGDGNRYSPGYPGLDLSENRAIYDLLGAEKLGITLTDAFEFRPTSTTGAVVCFHPEAVYG